MYKALGASFSNALFIILPKQIVIKGTSSYKKGSWESSSSFQRAVAAKGLFATTHELEARLRKKLE